MVEYILILSFILLLSVLEQLMKKYKFNISRLVLFFFILVFICGSISRGDYYSYLYYYERIDLIEPEIEFEYGFFWLSYFIKLISENYFHFLFIISVIGFLLKFYFLHKLEKTLSMHINYALFFSIYLSSFMIYLDVGSIRFSLACSILLVALVFLLERKYIYYILLISIASFFHASVIVAIVFPYVYKNNRMGYALFIGVIIGLLMIAFNSSFMKELFSMNYYLYKIISYNRHGTAILTFQLMKKILVLITFYWIFKRDIKEQKNGIVYLCWQVYLFGFVLWGIFMISQVIVSRYLLMFSVIEPLMIILMLSRFKLKMRVIFFPVVIFYIFLGYVYSIKNNSNEINLYLPYKNFIFGDKQPYRSPEVHNMLLSE